MNKSMFVLLFVALFFVSCDNYDAVFGDSTPEPVEIPVITPDTTKSDTSKVDSTTIPDIEPEPKPEPEYTGRGSSYQDNQDLAEVERILHEEELKEAAEKAARERDYKHAAEKRKMEAEIKKLQELSKPINLVRSKYKPMYPKAVEKLLFEIRGRYVKSMKARNQLSLIKPSMLKLFTLEYADDRMLEWLDKTVESNLKYIASKARINLDKCIRDKSVDADEFIHISKSKRK